MCSQTCLLAIRGHHKVICKLIYSVQSQLGTHAFIKPMFLATWWIQVQHLVSYFGSVWVPTIPNLFRASRCVSADWLMKMCQTSKSADKSTGEKLLTAAHPKWFPSPLNMTVCFCVDSSLTPEEEEFIWSPGRSSFTTADSRPLFFFAYALFLALRRAQYDHSAGL